MELLRGCEVDSNIARNGLQYRILVAAVLILGLASSPLLHARFAAHTETLSGRTVAVTDPIRWSTVEPLFL